VVDEAERAKNRTKSKVRARVEHSIGIIKRVFGFAKVRYRGLTKNTHRRLVTCALANLFMARRHLLRCQRAKNRAEAGRIMEKLVEHDLVAGAVVELGRAWTSCGHWPARFRAWPPASRYAVMPGRAEHVAAEPSEKECRLDIADLRGPPGNARSVRLHCGRARHL